MRRMGTLEEGRSEGPINEIYRDIERTLGVPFVGAVFRSLAACPERLAAVWPRIKAGIESRAFSELANHLMQRADALVEVTFEPEDLHAWVSAHGFRREDTRRVLYTLEALHYIGPRLLLVTAALAVAALGISDPRVRRRKAAPRSAEEPEFPTPIPRVMMEQAPNEVKEDYLDIIEVMGTPLVPDDFQALGRWPALLRRAWGDVKPVMRSTTFLDEAQGLSAFAIELAQELPHPVELPKPGQYLRRVIETYLSIYSRTIISTAAIRWMMVEGERTARTTGRGAGECEAR